MVAHKAQAILEYGCVLIILLTATNSLQLTPTDAMGLVRAEPAQLGGGDWVWL
jgi:hypothetical protein